MKRTITLLSIAMFVLLFTNFAKSQNPTYNITATNFNYTDSIGTGGAGYDAVTFDIVIEHTNLGASGPLEFALGQYYFNIDASTGVTSAGFNYYIVPGSTQFTNSSAIPRNPTIVNPDATSPQGASLRVNSNTVLGAGSGPIVATFPGTRVCTMRLKKKSGSFLYGSANMSWRKALPNPFSKIFAYVGTTNTDISNSVPGVNEATVIGTLSIGSFISLPVVQLVYPQNNSVNNQTILEFSWRKVASSVRYELLISYDSVFNNVFYDNAYINDSLISLGGFSYATNYFWRVKSYDISNGSIISSIWKFRTMEFPAGCTASWKNTLRINDAGNITDSLVFGTSFQGTVGIDTCLGERIIPPPPPTGVFDCRFQLLSNSEDSKKDFRKDSLGNITWYVKFQPSSAGYPVTFNWKASDLPVTGFFFLRDAVTGTIVNINMRNQNSYVLSNSGITSLKIEYLYKATMNVSVSAGWNISSVPLLAENMNVSSLFPGAVLPAYSYNNGYVSATTLTNGKGYWLKYDSYDNVAINGTQVLPAVINVNASWNIIGPFETNIPVNKIKSNPLGIVLSQYFEYRNGYFSVDTLKSGKGYWVKTSAAGTLMKDTTGSMDNIADSDSIDNWTRFEFRDENDNVSKLYLTAQNEIKENYDLPPVPPSGIFDIRFASDKFVEAYGQNHKIKLNTASGPVKIKGINLKENKYRIIDGITGNLINYEITEDNEIVSNENIDNLVLVEDNLIPKTYELSQNYPNPFNPSTTIKYQIPVSGQVSLILYNVLGKEIKTLLNSNQNAGVHEFKFDASGLPSGVYFYKINSGTFSDLKKMVLIK